LLIRVRNSLSREEPRISSADTRASSAVKAFETESIQLPAA
jgi:hypothetical protein